MITTIRTLRRVAAQIAEVAAIVAVTAAPALAQQPTDAQRSVIRSACGLDYQAHCASVPPGGMAPLQCLQTNMAQLSPSCQQAVSVIETPIITPNAEAAKPPEIAAPETTAPKTTVLKTTVFKTTVSKITARKTVEPAPIKAAANAAPAKPSSAQVAAIRSACRVDYSQACAGIPSGSAAALNCLENNKSKLSPDCRQAVSAAAGGVAPAATGTASGFAAAVEGPAPVLRPMRPGE